jgi:expansin (peptidoglycan-binding protein)
MVHGQRGGFSQDGYTQDGYGQDGYGQDGYGQDGYGQDGPRRHRRPRQRWRLPLFGRRPLLGLGVTGAGLAAIALAVMVGLGQLTGGQAACTSSALSLTALTAPAGTVSGIATHYVLEGLPNCSYPSPPANGLFVALSPSEYDSAGACGGYMTVTGPSGSSVTVQVIDQCPECATGHIDLSEPAFAELAPLGAGLINVRYQYLADPPLPGPITMEVKQGSSQYWLALLADNTGNPLASVQVETSSGGWVNLARANYNYWIAQSGAGSGPFTVRLTDTQGHTVTVRNVALNPGAVQSTGAYMYGAGSTQTAPTPARSSAAPTPTPTPTLTRSSASAAATASASAKPTSSAKSAKPSRSPSAHPSGTGTPAAKRKRAQAPAVPPATVAPTPAPTATPPC